MFFILITLVIGALALAAWFSTARLGFSNGETTAARTVTTVLLTLWILWSIILVVPVGMVSVATFFGTVQNQTYYQGLHVVNPLYGFHNMSVQRQIIEFQSGLQPTEGKNADDVVAVSNDNLPLTIDVTYAFVLNPKYASWLYRNIGDQDKFWSQLVVQAARAATRSATARFDYKQATTTERDLVAKAMEDDFRSRIIEDMVREGLSKNDADHVFTILPVQLRKVLPP